MPLQTLALQARGIGHVLRDRQLAVPAYQRPYAWTEDNVVDYWHDLKAALDRHDDIYFLGAIVLAGDVSQSDRDVVIDGQQRLATTSLLFAAFRDAFLAHGDSARAQVITTRYLQYSDLVAEAPQPRLRLSNQDHEFFERQILQRTAVEPLTASHRRLARAYRRLVTAVEKDVATASSREERISTWVSFVDKSVQVITVDVPTVADAFLIFETLNDRGAPLTIADLVKTLLMSRAGGTIQEVEYAWTGVLDALGGYDEVPEVADFLRHYWSSLHGATRERDLYRSIRDTLSSASEIAEFVRSLPQEAERYSALLDDTHPWWSQLDPLASQCMAILLDLGLAQNRPLLLALLESFSPDDVVTALRALVSWSVRGLIVGGIGGGRTERAFASAAVAVRSGKIGGPRQLFDNLRPIIPSDDEFRRSFEVASVPRRKIADYILKALETFERGTSTPPTVDHEVAETGFVHPVMPAHTSGEGWPGFAPDDIGRWVPRIGNYVLLERPRRPRAPSWDDMRMVLTAQPFKVTSAAARFESWRPETVQARQTGLAEEAVELWPRVPDEH